MDSYLQSHWMHVHPLRGKGGTTFPCTRCLPAIAPPRKHPIQKKCERCVTNQVCARFETRAAIGQSGLETCASAASRRETDISYSMEMEVRAHGRLIVSS